MKNFILTSFLFFAGMALSQSPKPDLAVIKSTEAVSLSLKGLSLEKSILQDKLITITELELIGDQAAKYKITYYKFKTTYHRTFSEDEFFDKTFTPELTQWFRELDSNCKIIFEDVVVQNTETYNLYKIPNLSVTIKMQE